MPFKPGFLPFGGGVDGFRLGPEPNIFRADSLDAARELRDAYALDTENTPWLDDYRISEEERAVERVLLLEDTTNGIFVMCAWDEQEAVFADVTGDIRTILATVSLEGGFNPEVGRNTYASVGDVAESEIDQVKSEVDRLNGIYNYPFVAFEDTNGNDVRHRIYGVTKYERRLLASVWGATFDGYTIGAKPVNHADFAVGGDTVYMPDGGGTVDANRIQNTVDAWTNSPKSKPWQFSFFDTNGVEQFYSVISISRQERPGSYWLYSIVLNTNGVDIADQSPSRWDLQALQVQGHRFYFDMGAQGLITPERNLAAGEWSVKDRDLTHSWIESGGAGSGEGFRKGPEQNLFSATDLATARAARDTYALDANNAEWLEEYKNNRLLYFLLLEDETAKEITVEAYDKEVHLYTTQFGTGTPPNQLAAKPTTANLQGLRGSEGGNGRRYRLRRGASTCTDMDGWKNAANAAFDRGDPWYIEDSSGAENVYIPFAAHVTTENTRTRQSIWDEEWDDDDCVRRQVVAMPTAISGVTYIERRADFSTGVAVELLSITVGTGSVAQNHANAIVSAFADVNSRPWRASYTDSIGTGITNAQISAVSRDTFDVTTTPDPSNPGNTVTTTYQRVNFRLSSSGSGAAGAVTNLGITAVIPNNWIMDIPIGDYDGTTPSNIANSDWDFMDRNIRHDWISIGAGGAVAGLSQTEVDARVRALVNSVALDGNTAEWDESKIPDQDVAFVDLTDGPGDIEAGKYLAGNSAGDELEFVDAPTGGGGGGVEESTAGDKTFTTEEIEALDGKILIWAGLADADWTFQGLAAGKTSRFIVRNLSNTRSITSSNLNIDLGGGSFALSANDFVYISVDGATVSSHSFPASSAILSLGPLTGNSLLYTTMDGSVESINLSGLAGSGGGSDGTIFLEVSSNQTIAGTTSVAWNENIVVARGFTSSVTLSFPGSTLGPASATTFLIKNRGGATLNLVQGTSSEVPVKTGEDALMRWDGTTWTITVFGDREGSGGTVTRGVRFFSSAGSVTFNEATARVDAGRILIWTGSSDLALTLPATVTAGTSFVIANKGTADITAHGVTANPGDDLYVTIGDTAGSRSVRKISGGGGGGATTFAALTDTPSAFTGHAGKHVAVNSSANALEFVAAPAGGTGVTTFAALTDTPSAFTGHANKHVAVNAAADALVFVNAPAGEANVQASFSDNDPDSDSFIVNRPGSGSFMRGAYIAEYQQNSSTPSQGEWQWVSANSIRIHESRSAQANALTGATRVWMDREFDNKYFRTPISSTGGTNNLYTLTLSGMTLESTFAGTISFYRDAEYVSDADVPDSFTDLDDTPSALSGQGGKFVAVNAAANALTFVDAPSGGTGTTSFTGLTDTPSALTGQGNKHVAVNSAANALVFVDAPAGEANVQANWTESDTTSDAFIQNKPTIPSSFSDLTGTVSDAQIPGAIARDSEVPDNFTDLDDTPSALSGQGGKYVAVNTAGDALVFVNAPSGGSGTTTFAGLTDTPSSLSGQGGKHVAVNSAGDALEFVTAPAGGSGVTTFAALTDTPANYTSQAGKFVAVNAAANALEFTDAPTGSQLVFLGAGQTYNKAATQGLDDHAIYYHGTADGTLGFAALDASDSVQIIVYNVGTPSSTDVWVNAAATDSGNNLTNWRIRRSSASIFRWDSDRWRVFDMQFHRMITRVRYNPTNAKQLQFGTQDDEDAWPVDLPIKDNFTELDDTPANYTNQANKFVAVNAGATALTFVDAPSGGSGTTTFTGLTDTPSAFTGQGNKHVAVNAAANALVFVDAPAGEANVQANWTESDSTSDAFIQNKPTIPSGFGDLTGSASDGQIPAGITRDTELTAAINAVRQLPAYPAVNDRDNKQLVFNGNALGWELIPANNPDLIHSERGTTTFTQANIRGANGKFEFWYGAGGDATWTIPDMSSGESILWIIQNVDASDDLTLVYTGASANTRATLNPGDLGLLKWNGTRWMLSLLNFGSTIIGLAAQNNGLTITDIAAGTSQLSISVTNLSDVPNTLSGQGGKHVAVNAAGNALEFVTAPAGGSGVTTFAALTDTPSAFTSQANKFVAVNSAANALVFVDAPAGEANVQANWTETDSTSDAFIQNKPTIPSSFSDLSGSISDSQIPGAIARDSEVPDNFTDLDDTPSALSGQGGKYVAVNTAGDALVFVNAPSGGAGVTTFAALTDTPSAFTNQANKFVAVNSGATALTFVDAPSGGSGEQRHSGFSTRTLLNTDLAVQEGLDPIASEIMQSVAADTLTPDLFNPHSLHFAHNGKFLVVASTYNATSNVIWTVDARTLAYIDNVTLGSSLRARLNGSSTIWDEDRKRLYYPITDTSGTGTAIAGMQVYDIDADGNITLNSTASASVPSGRQLATNGAGNGVGMDWNGTTIVVGIGVDLYFFEVSDTGVTFANSLVMSLRGRNTGTLTITRGGGNSDVLTGLPSGATVRRLTAGTTTYDLSTVTIARSGAELVLTWNTGTRPTAGTDYEVLYSTASDYLLPRSITTFSSGSGDNSIHALRFAAENRLVLTLTRLDPPIVIGGISKSGSVYSFQSDYYYTAADINGVFGTTFTSMAITDDMGILGDSVLIGFEQQDITDVNHSFALVRIGDWTNRIDNMTQVRPEVPAGALANRPTSYGGTYDDRYLYGLVHDRNVDDGRTFLFRIDPETRRGFTAEIPHWQVNELDYFEGYWAFTVWGSASSRVGTFTSLEWTPWKTRVGETLPEIITRAGTVKAIAGTDSVDYMSAEDVLAAINHHLGRTAGANDIYFGGLAADPTSITQTPALQQEDIPTNGMQTLVVNRTWAGANRHFYLIQPAADDDITAITLGGLPTTISDWTKGTFTEGGTAYEYWKSQYTWESATSQAVHIGVTR